MKLVRWMRFTWDLTQLPEEKPSIGPQFHIRAATPEEIETIHHVIISAFSLDSAWNDILQVLRINFMTHLPEVMESRNAGCLVLTHGARIIGASAYQADLHTDNHLLSGPCILSEYHNRGLGAALLYETLITLRNCGLDRAWGVTKLTTPSAKFIYPKFGGVGAPCEFELELVGT